MPPRPALVLALLALSLTASPAAAGGPVDVPVPGPPRPEPAMTTPAAPGDDVDLPEILARATGFWSDPPRPQRDARAHWTLLPFVLANPLMGFGVGAATIGGFRLGPADTTSFSSFETSGFITEKGQRGLVLRSDVRLPANGWILVGDWSTGRFPNPAFGIGGTTPASNETLVRRQQLQLHETVYRLTTGHLYAGVGWFLDDFYDIVDLRAAAGEPTAFSDYGVGTSGRSVASGLTLNLLWDGRDNPLDPTRGLYLLARYRLEPGLLGTDQDWRSVYLDARTYLAIPGRRDVLAFWAYAWSSFGQTPYLLLPSLGADPEHRSGRGYVEGRYTGKDLLYAEVEYRFHLWKFLGGVAAVNATAASERGLGTPGPLFREVHPGFVAGLRALLSKASRASLALDVAWAPDGSPAFYLNANQAF